MKSIYTSAYYYFFIAIGFSLPALANEITLAEMEKLQKAVVLAERVIDKTNDVAGAILVLEKANISKAIRSRPSNYPVGEYARLLYVYARCLFQTQARFHEAESVLNIILKLKPDHYHANFLYADFNYRMYKQTGKQQYRRLAERFYRHYASLLQENKLVTALPMRAIEMIYGDIPGGICGLVADRLAEDKKSELYSFLNPESVAESLGGLSFEELQKLESGVLFESFIVLEGGPIMRSFVDIDNDGIKETRYHKDSQTRQCTRNLFYKPVQGKSNFIGNELLARFYELGESCAKRKLDFLQYDDQIYIFEKQSEHADADKYSVYKLEANNSWENLCNFSSAGPATQGQYQLKSSCEHGVCRSLLAKVDQIIQSEGKLGFEKKVSTEGLASFRRQTFPADLRKFVGSPHIYAADIDNDGKNEFISRMWEQNLAGETVYQFRLFKQNLQAKWETFSLTPLKDDDWVFIESFAGVNYLVVLEILRTMTPERQAFMSYRLQIYYLQGNDIKNIGLIQLHENK